jgi:hypothetical protein
VSFVFVYIYNNKVIDPQPKKSKNVFTKVFKKMFRKKKRPAAKDNLKQVVRRVLSKRTKAEKKHRKSFVSEAEKEQARR